MDAAYENTKKWASNEGTTDTMKLLFGMGIYSAFDNMSRRVRWRYQSANCTTRPPS